MDEILCEHLRMVMVSLVSRKGKVKNIHQCHARWILTLPGYKGPSVVNLPPSDRLVSDNVINMVSQCAILKNVQVFKNEELILLDQ